MASHVCKPLRSASNPPLSTVRDEPMELTNEVTGASGLVVLPSNRRASSKAERDADADTDTDMNIDLDFNLDTFHPFKRLPIELRFMIWEFSCADLKTRTFDGSRGVVPAAQVPAVLHACVESRSHLTKKLYTKIPGRIPHHYTWVSFPMDTIVLKFNALIKLHPYLPQMGSIHIARFHWKPRTRERGRIILERLFEICTSLRKLTMSLDSKGYNLMAVDLGLLAAKHGFRLDILKKNNDLPMSITGTFLKLPQITEDTKPKAEKTAEQHVKEITAVNKMLYRFQVRP
ncbi:hypothetical protein F5Y16DRAFT_304490 [Xylariaceae sp. FL0255]|nr:hypothetical protein F5Y16DRAFT_304490 [Xylariaceae sp. FL0255]